MKCSEVRFTWYVDLPGLSQPKQRFRASEHDIEWLVELGCLRIDGWCVSTFQACWLPAFPSEEVGVAPLADPLTRQIQCKRKVCDNWLDITFMDPVPTNWVCPACQAAEKDDGGHQPGPPAGPPPGPKKRRTRG